MDMVCRNQSEKKDRWILCESRSDKDHTLTIPPPHSVVISVFAIIILSTIGAMFASGNHTVMGSAEDPKDGKSVATAVFGAVIIYGVSSSLEEASTVPSGSWKLETSCDQSELKLTAHSSSTQQVFLLFCGSQALLHKRQTAGGEIALR